MNLPIKVNKLLLRILEYLEKKKKVRLLGFALIILLSLIFIQHLKEFIVISLLFILASISVFYKRFVNIPIGFELISFTFVVLIFAYSPVFAIIMTIAIAITSRILTAGLDPTFFIQIGLYTLLGLFSFLIIDFGIVVGGMILVIAYNIIKRVIYVVAIGYDPVTNVIAGSLNIVINYFLLVRFGSLVVGLLS